MTYAIAAHFSEAARRMAARQLYTSGDPDGDQWYPANVWGQCPVGVMLAADGRIAAARPEAEDVAHLLRLYGEDFDNVIDFIDAFDCGLIEDLYRALGVEREGRR